MTSTMGEELATAIKLVSQIGVIAAYFHRARQGLSLPPVRKDLSEAAHFLYLINGEEPSREAEQTLDVAYVLHAEHGFNASTFTARVVASTLSRHVFRHQRRHRRAQGPAARRRQRRRDPHARGDRQRGQGGRLGRGRAGPEEEDHGHRPPRLQGARPARAAPQGHGREAQRPARRSRSGSRCASASRPSCASRRG